MPAFGIDFNTGKRETSADAYKRYLNLVEQEKKAESPFILRTPSSDAGSLTPFEVSADDYFDIQEKALPLQLKSTAQQNLLNVGSGLVFGAASIPFMEFQRNKELERQMQAFRMKEQSPTAQMARNVAAQQMAAAAGTTTAAKRNAFANLMRAAVEPLRTRR